METDDHTAIKIGSDGPEVEPAQLIRFLIERYDEMLENKNPNFPVIFKGLTLSGVAYDEKGFTEITDIISPAAQMRRCRDVLKQTLARAEEWKSLQPLRENGEKPFRDVSEREYRQMLLSAIREGKQQISSDNYEFAAVFCSIGWIALQCYPRRLAEFETVIKTFQDNPAEVVRRGKEVLWIAFRSKDKPE